MGGMDTWQVTVGNGWVLQVLSLTDYDGSTTSTGFDQGPSDFAVINISWGAAEISSTTTYATFFDMIGQTETAYLASYSFSVSAVGPAGVSPDPAVKPPYAGHPGGAGSSIRAGNVSAKTGVDATAPQAAPIANAPVWNTIIGTTPAGGTRPGSSLKPSQIQGQPTSVQPGAAVEAVGPR